MLGFIGHMNGCAHFDIFEAKECSVPWYQHLDTMHRICHHCGKIFEVGPRSGRSRREAPLYELCPLDRGEPGREGYPTDLSDKIMCSILPSRHYPVYFFIFIILACVFSIASVTLSSVSLSNTSIDAGNSLVSEPL
jgi:hypothetical protein